MRLHQEVCLNEGSFLRDTMPHPLPTHQQQEGTERYGLYSDSEDDDRCCLFPPLLLCCCGCRVTKCISVSCAQTGNRARRIHMYVYTYIQTHARACMHTYSFTTRQYYRTPVSIDLQRTAPATRAATHTATYTATYTVAPASAHTAFRCCSSHCNIHCNTHRNTYYNTLQTK